MRVCVTAIYNNTKGRCDLLSSVIEGDVCVSLGVAVAHGLPLARHRTLMAVNTKSHPDDNSVNTKSLTDDNSVNTKRDTRK